MLSYRHAFHAGGPADVLKHAVLAFVLARAAREPAPLAVLDTHAGAGLYDLTSAAARRTNEAGLGIGRLVEAPDPWPALMRPFRPFLGRLPIYPGSARIAAELLRPGDRLDLVELHPTDHRALLGEFQGHSQVDVIRDDGWKALRAWRPPRDARAIALIDPSYEIKSDYEIAPAALAAAWRRRRHGLFVLWYPVVDRRRTEAMIEAAVRSGMSRVLRVELGMDEDGAVRGMAASGLLVVNPPRGLTAALERGLPWLAACLRTRGETFARWVAAGVAAR